MTLLKAFDQYCWCTDEFPILNNVPLPKVKPESIPVTQEEEKVFTKPKIRKRKRKNTLPEIETHIEELLEGIQDGSIRFVYSCPKNINALTTDNSGRRSKYIGVSKNGQNWQVLINMGKYKKYIGTYPTEKEAALAYDFYSICLHSNKAKTNFSYDGGMISDMIHSFKGNNNLFEPARFLYLLN